MVLASLLSLGSSSGLLGWIAGLLGSLDPAGVRDLVLSFGAWAPLAYLLAMAAQAIVIPVPSAPVTLAGALVFGAPVGLALSTAGSTLVFLAVRRWGGPLVVRLVGGEAFRRYSGALDDGGWWLFAVLLVPFTPDDAFVALAGLTRIPLGRLLILMVRGRLPAAAVLLAAGVATGSTAAWAAAGGGVLALTALGLAYRKRLGSRVLGGTRP